MNYPFTSYSKCAADDYENILSNMENLYSLMDNLWLKVENIVAKGEIAHFEQFYFCHYVFKKPFCCRGIRKRLYEGKIWNYNSWIELKTLCKKVVFNGISNYLSIMTKWHFFSKKFFINKRAMMSCQQQ